MPEGIKQLSALERATSITPEALIYSEVEDVSSESGFYTRALPLGLLADGVANEVEFASALDTDSKTLIGAINELFVKGGGEGTTVVANPEEDATDTLSKIKIGDVVYSLETVDLPSAESEEGF